MPFLLFGMGVEPRDIQTCVITRQNRVDSRKSLKRFQRQTLPGQVQCMVSVSFFVQVHFSWGNGWDTLESFFWLSALARLRKVRCRAGLWVNLGWSCKGVGSTPRLHTLHFTVHTPHSTFHTKTLYPPRSLLHIHTLHSTFYTLQSTL